ncbi:MAG: lipoprotein N-acyltransferase Lnb domain-containing protein [Bdellovibrio sp.]
MHYLKKSIHYFFIVIVQFNVFIVGSTTLAAVSSNQLDPQKIKYVSYMMASPKGQGQSSFGHSYLLFKSDDYVSPTDLAVEFVAAVEPSELNYLRGLGLFPYDRKVVLENFNIIKKDITIVQNRDLLIYDLKLSKSQKENLINKINQILAAGKLGKYSFMSSNCAEAVSGILRDVGINVTGLTAKVPTWLQMKLEEKGLIAKTTTFQSVDNSRLSAVIKYKSSLNSIHIPKYYRKLGDMFAQADLNQQILNLLFAKQNMQISQQPDNVDAFVNSYWLTLSSVLKKQFKNMIAVPLGSVRLNPHISDGRSFSSFRIRSSEFDCSETTCDLKVFLARNDEKNDDLSFRFPVTSLTVKGNEIYFGELLIGVRLGAKTILEKNPSVIFAATPVVSKYSDNGQYIADLGIIIEKNLSDSFKKKEIIWNQQIIWQTNTDPQYPMCFTILHLQQSLFERAIFAPNLTQATQTESIQILKGLLSGRIAVVPGYKNATEFTKTISHEVFVKEFFPIQQQQYNGILNGMSEWFKVESLTPESLKAMAVLTHNLNISVPVIFRRANKSNESISHSVLITDMRDEGDHYSLSGYDPNFSHTDQFGTIDKATLVMTTKTYGEVNLYLDKIRVRESLLNLQIINSNDVKELLIKQASRLKRYVYSPNEILNMQ